jgi:nitric oxide reductase subunit B
MVFATLFPLGILQLYHSISVSYYDARTLNYIGSHANSILEWLRMPGDIVFIVGGALPILLLVLPGCSPYAEQHNHRRAKRYPLY